MGRVSAELGAKVYLDTNIVIYTIEGFADLAAQILADLGLSSIRLLTNRMRKLPGLDAIGIQIVGQVPLQP